VKLLPQGDLNDQDQVGRTVLHWSCFHKNKHAVKYFLKKRDIDVNIQDATGETPLHIACSNNDYDSVKMLLRRDADPTLTTAAGRVPSSTNQRIDRLLRDKRIKKFLRKK